MISLPKLLLEADGRKGSEVVLEAGERPAVTTADGREAFGEPLTEADLFDALTGVLAPEQQAELAVGNAVEFRLSSPTGEWTMVVEPALDGMVLRGRRGGRSSSDDPEVSVPMDLPPLAPFVPEPQHKVPVPEPVLKRSTRVDLGLASYAEDDRQRPAVAKAPAPAPAPSPDGKSPLPPPPPVAGLGPARGESGVDFAIVPDADGDAQAHPESGDPNLASELTVPPPGSVTAQAPLTPAQGVPRHRRPPNGKAAAVDGVDLTEARNRFTPGTLCFAGERSLGEQLARAGDEEVVVLDEPSAVDLAGRMLDELPKGATYLVRLEDPSRITAWVLRRLEEGSRIVLETRAGSLQGARRIFLGLHGEVAERWLSAHTVIWLATADTPGVASQGTQAAQASPGDSESPLPPS